jgi:hypothetical protein
LLMVLAFIAVAARAHGETRDGVPAGVADVQARPPAPSVEIAVVGTAADLRWVRTLFGASGLAGATPTWVRVPRFEPLDVLREHRPPERRSVRCWVDLSSPGRARLFFAAGSGERFLVRVIALSPRVDEMDQQALAEVLERSVTALLDDEQAGMDRAQAQALLESRWQPERPAPVARVTVKRSRSTAARTSHVDVAAFYAGQALSLARPGGNAVALVHGPGLSLGGSIGSTQRRWGLWAGAQLQFPHRELADDVGLDFRTIATRAGLELRQTIGGGAVSHLLVRIGTGFDLVHLTPLPGATDQSLALTGARWSTSLVLTAAVGVGLQVGERLRLAVTVFADVLPTTVHYDLAVEGQATPVFSPARVRPGVALQLAADVL